MMYKEPAQNSGMSADQIRAEIARLQEMLAQIEGGDGSDQNLRDPSFLKWLESRKNYYINTEKMDYFVLGQNGLQLDINKAANLREYSTWEAQRKRESAKREEGAKIAKEQAFKKEQERLREQSRKQQEQVMQVQEARARQEYEKSLADPNYVVLPYYQKQIQRFGFGNQQTSSSPAQNMPPAWS